MKTDRIVAIVLMLFGSLVFFYTKDWQMEAGLYPKAIALLIIFLALLLFIRPQRITKKTLKDMWQEALVNWQIIVVICLTLFLVLSIEVMGFFVSLPIYIILVMLVMGERKFKHILIPTVIATAIIYVVFVMMLQIRIPIAFFIT